MKISEIVDFLLPQWSDPLQVVFLTLILAMMILTIATTHWYASQSSWAKKWSGLDIDHGSVTDIWNAVATSPEKLAEIMPGLLLVVGLLGTFLGLGLALNHASHILGQSNALSASGAANSMQDLLGLLQGLGTKFKTSTWGITGFLLLKVWSSLFHFEEKRLTWVIKKVKSELEVRKTEVENKKKEKQTTLFKQINNAADFIGRSFEVQMIELKNQDKILHKNSIYHLEKNSKSIHDNLVLIANATLASSTAIRWLIENGVKNIRDDLADINVTAKAGSVEINNLLAQGLNNLRQGLDDINTNANNGSHSVRVLFEKTTQDIRGDLNSISVATKSSSEAIHHFVSSTQIIINGMSEAGLSMGKGAKEIGQAAVGMNDGASKIGKAANELVGAVGDFKNEFTTVLNDVRTDLGSAINNMSEQASQTLENGSKELKNATTGIADALGGLSESMQKTMNDLQKSISEVQTVQQKSAERFNQSNIALTEQTLENKELINNLGQNITDGLSAISDSGEKMVGIGRSLKQLIPKLMTLDSLPSALQPLVELPRQQQSLLTELQSMREALEHRDADSLKIQSRDAEILRHSTDSLNQSIDKAGSLINQFGIDVCSGLDVISASGQKIEKAGISINGLIPEMQNLKDIPIALHSLTQLPEQYKYLTDSINRIRQDFLDHESKFELIADIRRDIREGMESIVISNSQIKEIANSLRVIAPEIMKLQPALQLLGSLPARQESLHSAVFERQQDYDPQRAQFPLGQEVQAVTHLPSSIQSQVNTDVSTRS